MFARSEVNEDFEHRIREFFRRDLVDGALAVAIRADAIVAVIGG